MKKICAVTTVDITQRNFVIPAMRHLKANGWDVTIVCNMSPEFMRDYGDEFRLVNVPFHRGVSLKDMLLMPLRMIRFFRRESFDMVQYATPNASLYCSVAARLAGVKHRVYCQWGIRYVGCRQPLRTLLKTFEKLTCACSTHIRPASWKNLHFAVGEGLYKSSKAKAIGQGGTVGVDTEVFDIAKKNERKTAVLAEYPRLRGKTVFAFVGRLNRDKGVFELLEAFDMLQRTYAGTALLLIGNFEGSLPDRFAHIWNSDRIVKTGWTDDVAKYLSAADVLVHPSHREGFSMVIQQAMALGLPVITTDIPGPSEVVENGVSAILAEPCSAGSLFAAMERLLLSESLRQQMGCGGYRRCIDLFSRTRMLSLTLDDREEIIR